MIALVSQLFIAMIPIDCKITNFPYTCYYYSVLDSDPNGPPYTAPLGVSLDQG